MKVAALAAALVAVASPLTFTSSAGATFSGVNGQIAFSACSSAAMAQLRGFPSSRYVRAAPISDR
jgi:hypothetical protein